MNLQTWKDVTCFIHGDIRQTVFKSPWNTPDGNVTLKTVHWNDIDKENQTSCIFFLLQKGGTKNAQIREFYGCSVDADPDAGADPKEHKQRVLGIIDRFALRPSLFVETRKGVHIYWLFESPVDAPHRSIKNQLWRELQLKLAYIFDGDPAMTNPHQPIRLPLTYHRKSEPVFVPVLECSGIKYSLEDLESELSGVVVPKGWAQDKRRRMRREVSERTASEKLLVDGRVKEGSDRVRDIRLRRADILRSDLAPIPRVVANRNELHNYLTKEIDLQTYLDVNGDPVRCPFHHDTVPSAGVTVLDTGEQYFRCFSCGAAGNIRTITQSLTGFSPARTTRFLMEVFDVSLAETDERREHRERLEARLDRFEEEVARYPTLFKNVRRDLPLYRILLREALKVVREDQLRVVDGEVIFFASMRHLTRLLELQDHKNVRNKITNLCLHGFAVRLRDDQVPEALLASAHQQIKGTKRVSFYTLPDLTEDRLREGESIAMQVKGSGLCRDGLTSEGIARAFSIDVAERIFVQDEYEALEDQDQRLLDVLEYIHGMIERQGYLLERDLIEWCAKTWGNARSVARRKLKRIIPDLIQTYGIRREKLTRKLGRQLNVGPMSSVIVFL